MTKKNKNSSIKDSNINIRDLELNRREFLKVSSLFIANLITNVLTYSSLFDLSEKETKNFLHQTNGGGGGGGNFEKDKLIFLLSSNIEKIKEKNSIDPFLAEVVISWIISFIFLKHVIPAFSNGHSEKSVKISAITLAALEFLAKKYLSQKNLLFKVQHELKEFFKIIGGLSLFSLIISKFSIDNNTKSDNFNEKIITILNNFIKDLEIFNIEISKKTNFLVKKVVKEKDNKIIEVYQLHPEIAFEVLNLIYDFKNNNKENIEALRNSLITLFNNYHIEDKLKKDFVDYVISVVGNTKLLERLSKKEKEYLKIESELLRNKLNEIKEKINYIISKRLSKQYMTAVGVALTYSMKDIEIEISELLKEAVLLKYKLNNQSITDKTVKVIEELTRLLSEKINNFVNKYSLNIHQGIWGDFPPLMYFMAQYGPIKGALIFSASNLPLTVYFYIRSKKLLNYFFENILDNLFSNSQSFSEEKMQNLLSKFQNEFTLNIEIIKDLIKLFENYFKNFTNGVLNLNGIIEKISQKLNLPEDEKKEFITLLNERLSTLLNKFKDFWYTKSDLTINYGPLSKNKYEIIKELKNNLQNDINLLYEILLHFKEHPRKPFKRYENNIYLSDFIIILAEIYNKTNDTNLRETIKEFIYKTKNISKYVLEGLIYMTNIKSSIYPLINRIYTNFEKENLEQLKLFYKNIFNDLPQEEIPHFLHELFRNPSHSINNEIIPLWKKILSKFNKKSDDTVIKLEEFLKYFGSNEIEELIFIVYLSQAFYVPYIVNSATTFIMTIFGEGDKNRVLLLSKHFIEKVFEEIMYKNDIPKEELEELENLKKLILEYKERKALSLTEKDKKKLDKLFAENLYNYTDIIDKYREIREIINYLGFNLSIDKDGKYKIEKKVLPNLIEEIYIKYKNTIDLFAKSLNNIFYKLGISLESVNDIIKGYIGAIPGAFITQMADNAVGAAIIDKVGQNVGLSESFKNVLAASVAVYYGGSAGTGNPANLLDIGRITLNWSEGYLKEKIDLLTTYLQKEKIDNFLKNIESYLDDFVSENEKLLNAIIKELGLKDNSYPYIDTLKSLLGITIYAYVISQGSKFI